MDKLVFLFTNISICDGVV